MSFEISSKCIGRKFGSPTRKQVIMYLADKASDDGSGIWCSKGAIALETELSDSSVKRTLREFLVEGILVEQGTKECYVKGRFVGYTIDYSIVISAVEALPLVRNEHASKRVHAEPRSPSTPSIGIAKQGRHDPDGGSPRTPNNSKTIQKTTIVEDDALRKLFDEFVEAYPNDRFRNLEKTRELFTSGYSVAEAAYIVRAAKLYALETESHTRSLVKYSDNWLRSRGWQKFVEQEASDCAANAKVFEDAITRSVGWIMERSGACKYIPANYADEILARGLADKEQLDAAGVAYNV